MMNSLTATRQLSDEKNKLVVLYKTKQIEPSSDKHAFFYEVKEQTTPIFAAVDEWEKIINEAIKDQSLKLHPSLVAQTKENFELIIMHSYYHDVDEKRYQELIKSIDYVLDIIEQEMEAY